MGGKRRISCLHVRFQPVFVKCGVCGCVAERYLKQPAAGQRRTSRAASSARFCKRAYLCALRGPEDACGKQTRLLTPYPAGRGGIRAGGRGGRASRRLAAQGGKPRISSKIPLLFETSPFRGKRAVDKTAKPMKSARPCPSAAESRGRWGDRGMFHTAGRLHVLYRAGTRRVCFHGYFRSGNVLSIRPCRRIADCFHGNGEQPENAARDLSACTLRL